METINPEELLLKIIPILDRLKIDYFITGGFAVSVWGRPRATFDIDIVIKLLEPRIRLLTEALRKISKAGYIDEDVAREAAKQKGEFNFIDPNTGLKVDFWVVEDNQETQIEYSRRVAKKIKKQKIYFISPEDLILNKLQWHKKTQSDRHLEDIESIFKISSRKIDKKYLRKQAANLNVIEILNKYL